MLPELAGGTVEASSPAADTSNDTVQDTAVVRTLGLEQGQYLP